MSTVTIREIIRAHYPMSFGASAAQVIFVFPSECPVAGRAPVSLKSSAWQNVYVKPGLQGYVISCKCCSSLFVICKSCYRGQRYCSLLCRERGYAECRREARRRYDSSLEAKLDHRDRSRRFRRIGHQISVTDKSSAGVLQGVDPPHESHLSAAMLPPRGVCVLCGRLVWRRSNGGDG